MRSNLYKNALLILILFLSSILPAQPYAPPVGQAGTSAMYKDSSAFINWASGCTVTRGYQDISTPSLGLATVGDNTMATGKAQSNAVVSLGDAGFAICTFDKPIMNGAGPDFAVFENGFDDQFLELAFIEVSSDGQNFFRFHAHSLTNTVTQTSSFGSTDATKINNLAGKYRGGYGTPFDLQEMVGISGLDVNHITHVKVIDVVGSLDDHYATYDFYNNKINDPWTTAFPSGGFDLDAIGVIYESTATRIKEEKRDFVRICPNPVKCGTQIHVCLSREPKLIEVTDLSGKCLYRTEENIIPTHDLGKGVYFLKVTSGDKIFVQKVVVY